MTAPLARRWQFKRPNDRTEFVRMVEQELGAPQGGHVDIRAADGARVRVSVAAVVHKFWEKRPERWKDVPLIRQTIVSATSVVKSRKVRNSRGYMARLRLHPRRPETTAFVTWVSGTGPERTWESTFELREPRSYRRINVGDPIWTAHGTYPQNNPTPLGMVAGAWRSGPMIWNRLRSRTTALRHRP